MVLWFDVDGVVCNSNEAWLKWIAKEMQGNGYQFGYAPKLEDMTYWEKIRDHYGMWVLEWWKTPGSYKNEVQPYIEAIEFIDKYYDRYGAANFITSTYAGMEDEKDEFIRGVFGERVGEIIHAWNKADYLDQDDVLIEDNKFNCWAHVIKNQAYAIQLNLDGRFPYANFDYEITSHPRIYYTKSYDKVWDILEDIR